MGKTLDTYFLVESAAGYLLCFVKEWNLLEIDTIQKDLLDATKFLSIVQPKAFLPFTTAESALENMKLLAQGKASEELIVFLNNSLPSKKKKYQIAIVDSELAKDLSSKNTYNVIFGKDVFELTRCARLHITKLIDNLTNETLHQFQLGLGHQYSRSQVSHDPSRQDKHCSQAISTIELCDRTSNKFSMKLREWYGWHFPELSKLVPENLLYAKAVLVIGLRDRFNPDKDRQQLFEALNSNESLVNEIIYAMENTIGQEILDFDWKNIKMMAEQVLEWSQMRETINDYFGKLMKSVAPNLKNLVGDVLGSKLIAHAGCLTNLAKLPASTIQILGAEKALFRALKSRGPTPKYGMLFNSSYITKASSADKGKIARFMANKISLSARLDAFGTTKGEYGNVFREQIEERLNYLENGVLPRKNTQVMNSLNVK